MSSNSNRISVGSVVYGTWLFTTMVLMMAVAAALLESPEIQARMFDATARVSRRVAYRVGRIGMYAEAMYWLAMNDMRRW